MFCPPMPEFPVGPPPAAAAMAHEARRMARKRSRRRLFVHLVVAASADAVRKTGINPSKDRPIGGWGNRRRHRGATSDVSSPPGPSIRRTPGPCGHPRPRHTARPPACAGPAGTRRRLPVPAPAPAMSEVPESAAEVVAIAAEFPKNAAGSRHTGTIAAPPCDLTGTRAPPGSPASSPPPPHEPPASTRTDDRGPGHPPSSLRLSGEVRPTPGRPTRPPSRPEPPLRRPPPASTRTDDRRPRRLRHRVSPTRQLPLGRAAKRESAEGDTGPASKLQDLTVGVGAPSSAPATGLQRPPRPEPAPQTGGPRSPEGSGDRRGRCAAEAGGRSQRTTIGVPLVAWPLVHSQSMAGMLTRTQPWEAG
ncbi:hypothetical protein EKD16_20600 [Streptomonospora litoralis]|uniref:Uncharacterized protein n=1 Tax=Streptomonospora litoralis TaxID=2498135 RepID=A0A4P6Q973_9ACTN|nr:hypothetical protein EKD16_20600 [Streptomonospora litoralis]